MTFFFYVFIANIPATKEDPLQRNCQFAIHTNMCDSCKVMIQLGSTCQQVEVAILSSF